MQVVKVGKQITKTISERGTVENKKEIKEVFAAIKKNVTKNQKPTSLGCQQTTR